MKKNINLDLQKNNYSESKVLIISTKWNEEVIQSMLDDTILSKLDINNGQ